jgi:hypothetical protein
VADPGERANLAGSADHRDTLDTLRAKVASTSDALNARREAFKERVPTALREPRRPEPVGKPATSNLPASGVRVQPEGR